MASAGTIARIRDQAIAQLEETGREIAALLNIAPPELNQVFRDREYRQAQELRALGEFNQRVKAALQGALNPTIESPGVEQIGDSAQYEAMTFGDLKAEVKKRGLGQTRTQKKPDLVTLLFMDDYNRAISPKGDS